LNVLYFTAVPLDSDANGGNRCCRNHVRRLKQDPSINLFVVAAVRPGAEAATTQFLETNGIEHLIQTIRDQNIYQEQMTISGAFRFAYRVMTNYPWELTSMNQGHIDEAVMWATRHWAIDRAVVDYIYSALFCPSLLKSDTKAAVITLNQEAVFYKQMIDLGLIKHCRFTSYVSQRRLAAKERQIYNLADRVITIGANDNPSCVDASKVECIIPYLDTKIDQWNFSPSTANDVFFVGNFGHYPNRLAMEYIATCLAPALALVREDIRFKVVGASAADLPSDWSHPQIDYLGFGDESLVDQLFRSSGIFICPVKNEFGMKFKVAEAISYSIPLCASPETKKCIPFAPSVPEIDLGNAEGAVRFISSVAGDEQKLTALSASLRGEADSFIESQKGVWSRSLALM
jgi:Glycosyl transferases group 1